MNSSGSIVSVSSPNKARMVSAMDYITIFFALWLLSGVFVDGYAHGHIDETLETFFTPWHALLYSGFVACASWFAWLTYRNYRLGWKGREAIPHGYGAGVVGVLIFACGGIFDLIWHQIFGIEVGIEALYSPSHLLLFLGGTLIVASPLKRAWVNRAEEGDTSPRIQHLLPALLSLGFATSFTAFFAMNFWAFHLDYPSQAYSEGLMGLGGLDFLHYMYDQGRVQGIANILITNAILIIPVVWLLKRWNPPIGSFTILMAIPAVFMSVLEGFNNFSAITVLVVAGLIADMIWRLMRLTRIGWKTHMFLGLLSALIWGLYFLIIELQDAIAWEPEYWGGAIVLAALCSVVLDKLSTLNNQV